MPLAVLSEEQQLFQTILKIARRLCHADAYALWQWNEGESLWQVVADIGLSENYERSVAQLSQTLPNEVLFFEDVMEPSLLAARRATYAEEGIYSLVAVPLRWMDRHTASIACYYRQPHAFAEDEIHSIEDLAELASRAISAGRFNAEQQRLRQVAEQAERFSAFLSEASRLLASSLDPEATLGHVAELAVPELADWCMVYLVDGEGPPRQVAVTHADPARVAWAKSVRDQLPFDPEASYGVARVLRTGETEFHPSISEEWLLQRARNPEQLAVLRQFEMTSLMIVPLKAHQRVLGAMVLISAESGMRYTEKSVLVAEDLARRAAIAIENARLYREATEAVSARDHSEARLGAIIESSFDAIVSKDLNGIVQSWNKAAEHIFGYTEAEMVGQPIVRLVPPERPNEEPEILQRLRRGERVEHFETVRVRRDGRRIDVSVTISPIRDRDGTIIGASKIARDISGRKALQRELQERVEALVLADRRKDEFLAMLAHELRNPLSPLTTAARIIQKVGGDSPVLLRQQAVIERQVRQMSRLLDDLLDVSRITRGKTTLRLEPVELRQVVSHAAEACRSTIDDRQHALFLLLPDQAVPTVADPLRLEQVICNLLTNAAKYTDPGGKVYLTLEVEPGYARISVRDTGVGITPDFLPSVFDLFSQAERGLDRSQGGLGIGLTLVKQLVEMHGGTVQAASDGPGRGSEFIIYLPLVAEEPAATSAPGSRAEVQGSLLN